MKIIENFTPFKGIDRITFGTHRSKVRTILNSDFKEYKENDFTENTSDFFQSLGLFIEYDSLDNCNAIIFNKGTLFHLNYENLDLLELTYFKLRKVYDEKSSKKEEEEEIGITYYDLGFGVNKVFGADEIQTLLIFSEEYWID